MNKKVLDEICDGIATSHDPVSRRAFVQWVFQNISSVTEAINAINVRNGKQIFEPDAFPQFVHGGSAKNPLESLEGKVVVMGINPGWSDCWDREMQRRWQTSTGASGYQTWHNEFFSELPSIIEWGKKSCQSPDGGVYWQKVARILRMLMNDSDPVDGPWAWLSENVVGFEALPFHSKKFTENPAKIVHDAIYSRLIDASFKSLSASAARKIFIFSQEATTLIRPHLQPGTIVDGSINPVTKRGKRGSLRVLCGRLGSSPVTALGYKLPSAMTYSRAQVVDGLLALGC